MAEEKKEMVNHPNHYGGDTEYECIKVLKAWNTPEEFVGFSKDNAIKYLQTNLSDANKTTEKKKRGRPKKKSEVNAGNEATVTNVNDTNSETEEGDEE